jgi:phospholipid-binding lipoprotein MlaA
VPSHGNPFRIGNRRARPRVSSAVLLGLLLLACSGCAGVPGGTATSYDADGERDPAEPVNRAIFKVNVAADHAVMKPVAQAYTDHVPEAVQRGIHNVVQNFKEPAVAVNDALQGNVDHAWQSVQRLAVNSTVGVIGIFDVAEKLGVPPHKSDFGQTLGVWGVGEAHSSNCLSSAPRMRAMR